MWRWCVLFCWLSAHAAQAAGPYTPQRHGVLLELDTLRMGEPEHRKGEPRRAVAAVLAVALGPFGAHRLYLGTSPKVPVAYGLTFGAFGVLPLIDLGHILFTKDLDRYMGDRRILMWGEAPPTPP